MYNEDDLIKHAFFFPAPLGLGSFVDAHTVCLSGPEQAQAGLLWGVSNAFPHWEGVQALPISWWRYIIVLIKPSYCDPAGPCSERGGVQEINK